MDSSKRYQINQRIENALYTRIEQVFNKGQITEEDTLLLTPLIEMYQAIQLKEISEEIINLYSLFARGDASITIHPPHGGLDVNVDLDEPPSKVVRKPTKRKTDQ